jgi:ABC-type polysaccharide/polyol phosphate export permease
MAILLGMAVGGIFATTLRAAAIVVIGSLMFHVTYAVVNVPLLCAVFGFALIALYGMGMMFASLFLLFGREGWHIVNLVQEPVYLLSGLNFPVRTLGTAVASAAALLPALRMMRTYANVPANRLLRRSASAGEHCRRIPSARARGFGRPARAGS